MYQLPNIIESLDHTQSSLAEDTIAAIETLHQMFEIAAYFEVDYNDEERTLLSVENEPDEALIRSVLDGLYEEVQGRMFN